MWMVVLQASTAEMKAASVDGSAPDASYEVRRSWGERNLHHHFVRVDQWIRASKEINDAIGNVIGVAPIGSPNSYHEGFGETWARMNLQVIGERGEGVLHLPDVCADDPQNLSGVEVNEQSWTHQAR